MAEQAREENPVSWSEVARRARLEVVRRPLVMAPENTRFRTSSGPVEDLLGRPEDRSTRTSTTAKQETSEEVTR